MNKPNVVCCVILRPEHLPTGKTRHFYGTEEVPPPHELRIVKFDDDPGYYLFYCDENGKERTDTYHDSLEKAMSQANWEFNVQPHEWKMNF